MDECEHIDGTYDDFDDWGDDAQFCVNCDELMED